MGRWHVSQRMRWLFLSVLAALTACSPSEAVDEPANDGIEEGAAEPVDTPLRPAATKVEAATGAWTSAGKSLTFVDADSERAVMMIACSKGQLVVSLPGVKPIGSEDRLSFGGGGDVEALVATSDPTATSVTGAAPLIEFDRLAALLEAGPGASYGATAIGPLVPVSADQARAFVTGCGAPSGT